MEAFFRSFRGNQLRVQYFIEARGSTTVRQDDIIIHVNPDFTVSVASYNPRLSDFPERKGIHLLHMLNVIKQYLETSDLSIIVKGSPYNHKTVEYDIEFNFLNTYESAFKLLYVSTPDGWTSLANLYNDSM